MPRKPSLFDLMKIEENKKDEFRIPDDCPVSCDECDWTGILKDCPIIMDSEGWEYPEYEQPLCPKCEAAIVI